MHHIVQMGDGQVACCQDIDGLGIHIEPQTVNHNGRTLKFLHSNFSWSINISEHRYKQTNFARPTSCIVSKNKKSMSFAYASNSIKLAKFHFVVIYVLGGIPIEKSRMVA